MKKIPVSIKQKIYSVTPEFILDAYYFCKCNKGHQFLRKYRREHPKTPNEKIRIVFIVQRTEVFNSVRTIAESANKDERCDVFFLPLPRSRMGAFDPLWDTYETVVDFCKAIGYGTVLDLYNKEKNEFESLEAVNPDYIFLNVPYTVQYPEPYHIENLARTAKVCYVPYGYCINKKFLPFIYDSASFVKNIDFVFAGNTLEYNFAKKRFILSEKTNKKIIYSIGFPRFDLINSRTRRDKTVLWLPRWTADVRGQKNLELSSFLQYYSNFILFAKSHPDVNFIIRPHPLMFENFICNGIMSKPEIDAFVQEVCQLKNTILDTSPGYIDALNSASILLADFTSLLTEYYVSGNPIVYTGEYKDFSKYDREMVNSFYPAKKWEEVDRILEELLSGNDPKEAKRKVSLDKSVQGNNHHVGATIIDLIKADYIKQ